MKMNNNKVLIVKNIAREGAGLLVERLNSQRISFDIADLDKGEDFPEPKGYSVVFVFGGPDSANDTTPKIKKELKRVTEAIKAGVPYFGVCLGMQILVKAGGGEIFKNEVKEIGWRDQEGKYFEIELTKAGKQDPLFSGLSSSLKVFHLHGETVRLTDRMKLLATGKHCKNQVVKINSNAYGFQGHIELTSLMFEEWVSQEPDLRLSDKIALSKDYSKIKNEYEFNGRKIFDNFLSVTGVIK